MSAEHVEAVVVGSGFGGSVMAYRLAEADVEVCLLERGKAYPPGSFPRSPHTMRKNFWDPSEGYYGLYNVWTFEHIDGLVSSGLGGGSLIYANVLIRKDADWFVREEPGGDGYEHWPVTREVLDPHYGRVEEMMNVQRFPHEASGEYDTPKTQAMKEAAEDLGMDWQLPNLAVTFSNPGREPVPGEPVEEEHGNLHGRTRTTCRLCGECDIGCNYGSKNTLDFNYLSEAERLGADLRTLCEVKRFRPREGGGYRVGYLDHDPDGPRPEDPDLREITCDYLVLAAGTFGSTFLLLKNRDALPALGDRLGTGFSGNGDFLGFAFHAEDDDGGTRDLDGSFGPVITSAIRGADRLDGGGAEGRGFYIEDAGYPSAVNWLIEAADAPGLVRRALRFAWQRIKDALGLEPDNDVSAEMAALIGGAELSRSSMPLLGMGRDVPNGELSIEAGQLASDWTIDASSEYFARLRRTMRGIARSWNADFADNPIWHFNRRLITVHPLGGCPMGPDRERGVVNDRGEVFGHPGLYVADGSIMPGPVGPNPSLTIAAMADRAADDLIRKHRQG